MRSCFNCQASVELAGKIGRREVCPRCGRDLHVCRNCLFHDSRAYNACRESQAERVLDKERSNYCEYFVFREGTASGPEAGREEDKPLPKDRLAALFK